MPTGCSALWRVLLVLLLVLVLLLLLLLLHRHPPPPPLPTVPPLAPPLSPPPLCLMIIADRSGWSWILPFSSVACHQCRSSQICAAPLQDVVDPPARTSSRLTVGISVPTGVNVVRAGLLLGLFVAGH